MNLFDTPSNDNKKVSKTACLKFSVGDLVQVNSTISFVVDRGEDRYVFGFYGHITAIENGQVTIQACNRWIHYMKVAGWKDDLMYYTVRVGVESIGFSVYGAEVEVENV